MSPILPLGVILLGGLLWFRHFVFQALPATADLSNPLTRKDVRIALRLEAINGGYNPDWFDAIAYVESNWKLDALNQTGTDAYWGGSYGPMQMTAVTANRLGYDPIEFLTDARKAGEAAVANFNAVRPKTFADAVSYWNAGVPLFVNLPEDNTARTEYYPRAIAALDWVSENPPED